MADKTNLVKLQELLLEEERKSIIGLMRVYIAAQNEPLLDNIEILNELVEVAMAKVGSEIQAAALETFTEDDAEKIINFREVLSKKIDEFNTVRSNRYADIGMTVDKKLKEYIENLSDEPSSKELY